MEWGVSSHSSAVSNESKNNLVDPSMDHELPVGK